MMLGHVVFFRKLHPGGFLEPCEASSDGIEPEFFANGSEYQQPHQQVIHATRYPAHLVPLFARMAGDDTTAAPTPPVTARPGEAR